MKTNTLLIIGAVAVAGFVLYKKFGKNGDGTTTTNGNGNGTLTQAQADAIAAQLCTQTFAALSESEIEYNSMLEKKLEAGGYIVKDCKALKAIGVTIGNGNGILTQAQVDAIQTMQPQFIGWGFSGGAINGSFRNY